MRQRRQRSAVAFQDRFGEVSFGILQLQNPLFNGVLYNQAVNGDLPGLADPVCAVGCLVLGGHVPPRIVMNDHIGAGEVEACATCF